MSVSLIRGKKGKVFTEEHCRKIGAANTGRKLSDETREKIALKHGKPIIQMDMNGNYVERHRSIKAAAAAVGLKSSNSIKNALNGTTKQSAGYRWAYG